MANIGDKGRIKPEISGRHTRAKGRPVVYMGLLLVVLIVMFVLYNPNLRSGRNMKNPASRESAPAEPQFTREGELSFLRADGTEITKIDIEIADDDYQRERGLMYRKQMQLQQGMLFIFEEEEIRSFWMKNTYLPLDILYVNEAREVVRIHENTPTQNENPIPSGYPAKYVVEVNAGFCAVYGIKTGDKINFNR
jgi:hypothetical protein